MLRENTTPCIPKREERQIQAYASVIGTDVYHRIADCRGDDLLHSMDFGIPPLQRCLRAGGAGRRYKD